MGYSILRYPYSGSNQFNVNFTLGYISRSDVFAYVEGELDGEGEPLFRPINWVTDNIVEVTGDFNEGDVVVLQRIVSKQALVADFRDGTLDRNSLQNAFVQSMMAVHELFDGVLGDQAIVTATPDVISSALEFIEANSAAILAVGSLSPTELTDLTTMIANSETAAAASAAAATSAQAATEAVRDEVVDAVTSIEELAVVDRPTYQEVVLLADLQPDANPDSPPAVGSLVTDQVQTTVDILAGIPVHHPRAKSLIFAGDILDRGYIPASEEGEPNPWFTFSDMIAELDKLPFNDIYAIAGNHDRDYRADFDPERPSQDPKYYYKTFFPKNHYHVIKGNTLYIFMGDQGDTTGGRITDVIFDWWLALCRKYRNYNKVVVTHQALPGTGMANTTVDDSIIQDSERFIDAMTTGDDPVKIDCWVRGHINSNSLGGEQYQRAVAHNGCLFLNVGLHIPTAYESATADLSYVVMCQSDGTADVVFKRWDHATESFVVADEYTHTFSYPLRLEGKPSFDGRYQASEFDVVETPQTVYMHWEYDSPASPGYGLGPYWGHQIVVDDRKGVDTTSGLFAGYRVSLPGGVGGNETHNFGFGAGWGAESANGGETNWSADFVGFASGSGQEDDSRVEAFRGHGDGSLSTPEGVRSHFDTGWLSGAVAGGNFRITHNLNTQLIEFPVELVREVSTGRVFRPQRQNATSSGYSIEFIDDNTIEIAVANSSVFYYDNTHTGATTTSLDGEVGNEVELRFMLRKVPDA